MNNPPIPMIWKESSWDTGKEVLVYDFIHETIETFCSFALCWVPSAETWTTISVAFLTPVLTNKKLLKEDVHEYR